MTATAHPPTVTVFALATAPTIRALAHTPAFGVIALAFVPLIITVLRGGTDLSGAVMAAVLIGSSALGFAVDDAAGATVASVPTSRAARRFGRGLVLLVTLIVASGTAAALASVDGAPLGPLAGRAPEAVAIAGVAFALASWMGEDSDLPAGTPAAGATVLVALTSTAMGMRFAWLPQIGPGSDAQTWWLVAAAAWTVALWLNRDPVARRW